MKKNKTLIFFKILLIHITPIQHILGSFPLDLQNSSFNVLNLHHCISFNVFLNLSLEMNVHFMKPKKKKVQGIRFSEYGGCCTCIILCFAQNF